MAKLYSRGFESRKLSTSKRRPLLKSQISNPELIFGGNTSNLPSHNPSEALKPVVERTQRRRAFSLQVSTTSRPRQVCFPTKEYCKLRYQLAEPRLSPMEYTRLYLIEKAMAGREGRPCELPSPEKLWYWTPQFEKFLIIPKVPDCIQRDFNVSTAESVPTIIHSEVDEDNSDAASIATLKPDAPKQGFSRLSLNLGRMSGLFQSLSDILPSGLNGQTYLSEVTESENIAPRIDRAMTAEFRQNDIHYDGFECANIRSADGHSQQLESNTSDSTEYPRNPCYLDSTEIDSNVRFVSEQEKTTTPPARPFATSGKSQVQPQNEMNIEETEENEVNRTAETSSLYSQDTVETAVFLGKHEVLDLAIPVNLDISRSRPRQNSNPTSATPVRRVIDFSSHSTKSSCDMPTPLAHFPIAVEPTSRLTPSTLTRQVIGNAGGCYHTEDAQQAQLVRSVSANLLEAFAADVWTMESEDSMLSELQPEPLRLGQRESPPVPGRDLRDEVSGLQEQALLESGAQKRQARNFTEPTFPSSGKTAWRLQLKITPENSEKSLVQNDSSFFLSSASPSGFTPRHRESSAQRPALETPAPMNYNDEEVFSRQLEKVDEAVSQMRAGKRFGVVPPKKQPSNTPGPHYQGDLKKQQRAPSMTPQGMKSFDLWRNGHAFHTADTAASLTSDSNDAVYRAMEMTADQSIATRDFYQARDSEQDRSKDRFTPYDALGVSSVKLQSSDRLEPGHGHIRKDELHTPSPPDGRESAILRTPTSAIGSFFRKRTRSEYVTTPRTPITPRTNWRPFEESRQEPPCSSPWTSGRHEDKREKMERAAYFRNKVERESMIEMPEVKQGRSKNSLRNLSRESLKRRRSSVERRQSVDSLMGWRSFIDDSPVQPPTSSPLPPVPLIPSLSKLNNLTTTKHDFSAPAPSDSGYRSKKPQGLKVETNKLRKTSKEGPQSARKTESSGGLRTAFKIDGRRLSFGKPAEGRRTDEVVQRRKAAR